VKRLRVDPDDLPAAGLKKLRKELSDADLDAILIEYEDPKRKPKFNYSALTKALVRKYGFAFLKEYPYFIEREIWRLLDAHPYYEIHNRNFALRSCVREVQLRMIGMEPDEVVA